MVTHRLSLFFHILRLNRQADGAVLAIHVDDLDFNFVVDCQCCTSVFHPIKTNFRSLHDAGYVFSKFNHHFLNVGFNNLSFNDTAAVVDCGVVGEGVLIQLLDAQRNALALWVN